MTNDARRKPEGAPERSPKAGAGGQAGKGDRAHERPACIVEGRALQRGRLDCPSAPGAHRQHHAGRSRGALRCRSGTQLNSAQKGGLVIEAGEVEALLDGEAETLTRKAIELAKAGDLAALRVCLDRIAPPRKDRPVLFEFPPVSSAADARSSGGAGPTISPAGRRASGSDRGYDSDDI